MPAWIKCQNSSPSTDPLLQETGDWVVPKPSINNTSSKQLILAPPSSFVQRNKAEAEPWMRRAAKGVPVFENECGSHEDEYSGSRKIWIDGSIILDIFNGCGMEKIFYGLLWMRRGLLQVPETIYTHNVLKMKRGQYRLIWVVLDKLTSRFIIIFDRIGTSTRNGGGRWDFANQQQNQETLG